MTRQDDMIRELNRTILAFHDHERTIVTLGGIGHLQSHLFDLHTLCGHRWLFSGQFSDGICRRCLKIEAVWIRKELSIEVGVFRGRRVILWTMPDGSLQPFYESSGKNSGQAGTWFPFDGWTAIGGGQWFIKCNEPIKRFGTEEMKTESLRIATLSLSVGDYIEDGQDVNEFLSGQGWEGPPSRDEIIRRYRQGGMG